MAFVERGPKQLSERLERVAVRVARRRVVKQRLVERPSARGRLLLKEGAQGRAKQLKPGRRSRDWFHGGVPELEAQCPGELVGIDVLRLVRDQRGLRCEGLPSPQLG